MKRPWRFSSQLAPHLPNGGHVCRLLTTDTPDPSLTPVCSGFAQHDAGTADFEAYRKVAHAVTRKFQLLSEDATDLKRRCGELGRDDLVSAIVEIQELEEEKLKLVRCRSHPMSLHSFAKRGLSAIAGGATPCSPTAQLYRSRCCRPQSISWFAARQARAGRLKNLFELRSAV